MSAVDSVRRPSFRASLLLGVLAVTFCAAQEPVVVRLRDAVGDTIDLAERDSFNLFPNTAGFQRAVILALPGPEFYAEITRPSADSTADIFLRIMPTDLERIRFLIDNHNDVAAQQRSDSSYARALASFWQAIEDKPLRNMAGEPAIEQEVPLAPTDVAPAGEPLAAEEVPPPPPEEVTAGEPPDTTTAIRPQLQPASIENRYNYTLHGVTIGSAAGGCVGSHVAIEQVGYSCGGCVSTPVYEVNQPLFWTTACGLTALGSTVGYLRGKKLDSDALTSLPTPPEGTGWRIGCAIGAAIPGIYLGTSVAEFAGWLHWGKAESIRNDPQGLTVLPGVLTGLCVAVQMTTIGYHVGRAIDRRNAAKAAARRRALGR